MEFHRQRVLNTPGTCFAHPTEAALNGIGHIHRFRALLATLGFCSAHSEHNLPPPERISNLSNVFNIIKRLQMGVFTEKRGFWRSR